MHRDADIDEKSGLLLDVLYGERDAGSIEMDASMREELDSFSNVRAMFRSMPEAEPPSAITAKLLSAAAAHASRAQDAEAGGVWAFFVRMFRPLAQHPALAAAASFVVVAGIAGTLYVTNKVEVAQPALDTREEVTAATPPSDREAAQAQPTSSADRRDGQGSPAAEPEPDESGPPESESPESESIQAQRPPPTPPRLEEAAEKQRAAGPGRSAAGQLDSEVKIRARRPAPASPAEQADPAGYGDSSRAREGGNGTRGVLGDDVAATTLAQDSTPAPSAPSKSAPSTPSKSAPSAAPKSAPAPKEEKDAKPLAKASPPDKRELDTGAAEKPQAGGAVAKESADKKSGRSQAASLHAKASSLAVAGDCKRALALGEQIRKLDSRYYDETFLADAKIRACRAASGK